MSEKELSFGEVVQELRWANGMTQTDLAKKIGKSLAFIQRVERKLKSDDPPVIRPNNFAKLAEALGMNSARLRKPFTAADLAKLQDDFSDAASQRVGDRIARTMGAKLAEWEDYKKEHDLRGDSVDLNVDPGTFEPVPDIPTFDMAVAAGPWTEVIEPAFLDDPKAIEDGRFRIWIRGDSMERDWPDGSLVEFRRLRPAGLTQPGDELKMGGDYYVQVGDLATFKRLENVVGDEFRFRAVNRRKYPKLLTAHRDDIVRMAKAEYLLKKVG